MQYIIKDEFLKLWGIDDGKSPILTDDDIVHKATIWRVSSLKLYMQVTVKEGIVRNPRVNDLVWFAGILHKVLKVNNFDKEAFIDRIDKDGKLYGDPLWVIFVNLSVSEEGK